MSYRVLQERPDRLLVELPNRMIVVAQEVRTTPIVSAHVWIKTGSLFEQEHVGAGLSHFLEHLLAGGSTSTRPEAESNALLGAIGAQTNAATSLDTVRYYINTTSEHAGQALDLLSDWMQNSLITQEEFDRERSVIQREFEMGQGDPGRVFWKLTQQARFGDHHPGRHPTIGYLEDFLSITRDEIEAFYRRMYVPNNMVFVVVGDIDKQAVVDRIARLWSDVVPGELPEVGFPDDPPVSQPIAVSGAANIDQPRLRLAWVGARLSGESDYELDLITTILGDGESSRLVRSVRDDQRLVNTVSAYNMSFAWGKGIVAIDAAVQVPSMPDDSDVEEGAWRQQHIEAAKEAILDQVRLVREQGVTDEEVARAKRKAVADVVYHAQSAQALAGRLARDLIGMSDPDFLQRYARDVQGVSAEAIQAAARRVLDPERLITIELLPTAGEQATTAMSRPTLPDGEAPGVEPFDLDNRRILAKLREGAGGDADPFNAVEVQPTKRYVMSNGLRLLVGRSTVVPAVAIQVYRLGGLLAEEPGREGVANAADMMLMKGTTTRSAQELAKQIEDLGASLSTLCGNNTSYARAVCLREDWPAVMELLADVTLNPTFPEDEWEKLRPRLLAAIEREADTWRGELGMRFREAYFGEHPWAVSPLGRAVTVESLTTDQLREYHRHHLGAATTVVAVFGDVDPDRVAAEVERLLGGMPAVAEAEWDPTAAQPPAGSVIAVRTDKPLAAVQIGFGPGVTRDHPDYPKLQVLTRVLSAFPTGWLEQELRGRGPGLVYAVGARQATGVIPGYVSVLFNTQPESVGEAVTRTMAVIDRAITTAVDEPTLARAKAKTLMDEDLYKQSNSDRAADAALNELFGLSQEEAERFRLTVQQLTSEGLQSIAQQYLRQPVAVVLSHQSQSQAELREAVGLAKPVAEPSAAVADE